MAITSEVPLGGGVLVQPEGFLDDLAHFADNRRYVQLVDVVGLPVRA